MQKIEVNHGKFRSNSWKWKDEIDKELEFYRSKECECGCGKKLNPTRKQVRDSRFKKKPLRVLKGHHNRLPEAKWIKSGKDHPMFGRRGALAPGWKGGKGKKRTDYGKGWETARRHTLKRDNYTCQICWTTRKERRIDVHHKIPFKEFRDHLQANKLENLISVCYKCHQIEEWKIRGKVKNGVKSVDIEKRQYRAKLRNEKV